MKSLFTFMLLMLVAVSVSAIEFRPSPLMSELALSRYALDQDEFDEFDDEPKSVETNSLDNTQDESGPKVSAYRAGLYSMILPGWGQRLNKRSGKSRVFFAVEAISWIGFASYRIYGNWKKDDMIEFAASAAGASLEGKDDEFLDFVGFYEDIDEYNTFGRVFDPDRPYREDNVDNHWRWQSIEDQAVYRNLKNQSRESHRRANFMLGIAALNRIVSVIDAVRDALRAERVIDESFSDLDQVHYRLTFNPMGYHDQVKLTLLTGL